MRVKFGNCSSLEYMDTHPDSDGEYEPGTADELRHRLKILRDAESEEPLLALRALRLQRMEQNSYTMRVNDEVAMEVEFDDDETTHERCVVINRVTSNHNYKKGDLS